MILKELRDQGWQKAATPLRDQEMMGGSGVARAGGWPCQAGAETKEGLSGQHWDLKGKAGGWNHTGDAVAAAVKERNDLTSPCLLPAGQSSISISHWPNLLSGQFPESLRNIIHSRAGVNKLSESKQANEWPSHLNNIHKVLEQRVIYSQLIMIGIINITLVLYSSLNVYSHQ